MPYAPHEDVTTPPDSIIIWRYMDFAKFVSILEDEALFFPQIAKLNDPFEGSISNLSVRALRNLPEEASQGVESFLEHLSHTRVQVRASCWHMNARESEAMWRLYAQTSQGIAVRTTVGHLKAALKEAPESVHIGLVQYRDYDVETVPPHRLLAIAHSKRDSFSHEREVRLTHRAKLGDESPGTSVRIAPQVLLRGVYVAPQSPSWLRGLTQNVLARYGIDLEVTQSALDEKPAY